MSLYFGLTVPSATCVVLKHWDKWLWLLLMAVSVAGSKAASLSWSLAVLPRRNPNLALAENPWWKKQQTYTSCKSRFCVNNLNPSISYYQTPYLWLSLYMMLVIMVLQMKCESRGLQYLLGPEQGRTGLQDGCPQGRGALWEHRTEPDKRKTPQARQPRHQHGHNVLSCVSLTDRHTHTVMSKNWPDNDISKCLASSSQSQLALIH